MLCYSAATGAKWWKSVADEEHLSWERIGYVRQAQKNLAGAAEAYECEQQMPLLAQLERHRICRSCRFRER